MNFQGNLLVSFYVFFIFCVRRSIDAQIQKNQPGSGFIWTGSWALGLTENKKYTPLQKYYFFCMISTPAMTMTQEEEAEDPGAGHQELPRHDQEVEREEGRGYKPRHSVPALRTGQEYLFV